MDNDTHSIIDTLACELAEHIENCESRKQYMKMKAKIGKNSLLAFKIKEFKRAHLDFQLKLLNNNQPTFEEERHVSKLYADLMLNDDARDFLEQERAMLNIMTQLHDVVNASCGIDMDF